MEILKVFKIGGQVVNNEDRLESFLERFQEIEHPKLLVHGGGSSASDLCRKLDIPIRMNEGRRITDAASLDVAVMVYAGLINKNIVAGLQAGQTNAIGLSGADLNIIPAQKRTGTDIDYGFVGDIDPENISTYFIRRLLDEQIVAVFPAITHDNHGQLLNTNADTIAAALSMALSEYYEVELTYCFEKEGVMKDLEDEGSLIHCLGKEDFDRLKQEGVIQHGMIPKLDTAFEALRNGVSKVHISSANNITNNTGTELTL